MQIIKRGNLKLLLSDENKHIRDIKDVYVPESVDPVTGKLIHEHIPHYSQMIFLAEQIKDEDVPNMYVEELMEEE